MKFFNHSLLDPDESGLNHEDGKVLFPAVAQITVSSVEISFSLGEVDCVSALCGENHLRLFIVFYASKSVNIL